MTKPSNPSPENNENQLKPKPESEMTPQPPVENTEAETAAADRAGKKADNDVALPALGLRGTLRWAWTQLTSMRTALFLLLLLAVAAVPGSLFPQRPANPGAVTQYIQDNPDTGPWLDRFQLFDVYASVWFSAIYLLLFISLIGCVIPRAKVHWKALRSKPPRTPTRLSRLPEYGTLAVPAGTGLTAADAAREAGADFVGLDDLLEKIKGGWLDFDVAVATPDMMGTVGRLGKILGPRGLMPNPKLGTVTMDLTKAVSEIKAGKVEYRTDKAGNVHCPIGKASFTEEQLSENLQTLIDAITKARPAAVKGQFLKSVTIASTMGPGVKLNPMKL